jgi:hypothetical protein
MIGRAFLLVAVLVFALRAWAVEPPPERTCAICGTTIPRGVRLIPVPAMNGPLKDAVDAGDFASTAIYTRSVTNGTETVVISALWICDACRQIPDRCSLCRLPINDPAKAFRTSDGRWVCSRDFPLVVMDEDSARELFESARDAAVDVIGDFFTLKSQKVNVRVTDVFDRAIGADDLHTMAVSKTTDSGSEIVHYVSLYTGQPKKLAFYSCVHEYTHLWINENIHQHEIEADTREALCELVAYKVAESRKDTVEQRRIIENPYTRGCIKDLVQYASQEDMSAILNWVPNGTTPRLAEGVATATALKAKPPEIPLDVRVSEAQLARAQSQPKKETLGLNGIIHTPKGTIILLNKGLILGKGESGVLTLNGEQSRIRCIDIATDSAVVQWENSTNTLTLTVTHK